MSNGSIRRSTRSATVPSPAARFSGGRVTRSQLEQQQKLRALYADSFNDNNNDDNQNNNSGSNDSAATSEEGLSLIITTTTTTTRSRRSHSTAKENFPENNNGNNNHCTAGKSMTPSMNYQEDASKTNSEGSGATTTATMTMTTSSEKVNNNNNTANSDATRSNKSAVTPSPRPNKSLSPTPRRSEGDDPARDAAAVIAPPAPPPPTEEEAKARAARRLSHPLAGIPEPGPNDCLFGRGGGTNHHPGNKLYRKKVEDKKGKYLASKRLDKPLVAMEIISEWRALDPPGRFLKQNDRTKFWDDVGDKKAREKTSQALREKTPVKTREEEQGGDHYNQNNHQQQHHPGPVNIRGHEQQHRSNTARFQPGTASPVGRHVRKVDLARDHSLGETVLNHNEISLEGFSWDDSDKPVVRNADADVGSKEGRSRRREDGQGHGHGRGDERGGYDGRYREPQHRYSREPYPGERPPPPQYGYRREHSLSNNPLSDATTNHPAPPAFGEPPPHSGGPPPGSYYGHHYPGYPPPPTPPGYEQQQHAPPPPYHHPSHYSSPTASSAGHAPQPHHAYSQYPPQPPDHRPAPPQRGREHSLQMNPLEGASASQPARDFADDASHASYDGHGHGRPPPLPSPHYEGRPPPLPPSYYGGGYQSPRQWPAPPGGSPGPRHDPGPHRSGGGSPHHGPSPGHVASPPPPPPQFAYHPGSNPSAFGRYDSGDRSNSLKSLGSSVDAYYDRNDSVTSSVGGNSGGNPRNSIGSTIIASPRSSTSSAPAPPANVEDAAAAGSSQDYSKIAELIRDSSDKSSTRDHRSNSWNESETTAKGYEDVVPRSKSMPYEEGIGTIDAAKHRDSMPPPAAVSAGVQQPSLLRKLSGGGMRHRTLPPPPAGILRPAPVNGRPEHVKRDTSNQPETLETKRSIKRVVLSRDQSAVSRRLKEEQFAAARPRMGTRVSSRLTKAEMLDRKMSVEMKNLGLDDNTDSSSNGGGMPMLNRMTTEDVLASLIDDEELELLSPSPGLDEYSNLSDGLSDIGPPKPMGQGDRVTTIDAIAMDIANGTAAEEGVDNWDATLDLVVEEPIMNMASPPPDLPHADSGGLNADIAEKWLKGET